MSTNQDIGQECSPSGAQEPTFIPHPNRETRLGDLEISRAPTIRQRRTVSP